MPEKNTVTTYRPHRFYYQVGTHNLLMESDLQAEVLLHPQTTPLPFSPTWCLGLIALRGNILPLISLHHVLYGHKDEQAAAKIKLWLKPKQGSAIVVECDSYPKAIVLDDDLTSSSTTEELRVLPSWIKSMLLHEKQPFLVADHYTLIRNLHHAMQTAPT